MHNDGVDTSFPVKGIVARVASKCIIELISRNPYIIATNNTASLYNITGMWTPVYVKISVGKFGPGVVRTLFS
jgi:hypothetical protein